MRRVLSNYFDLLLLSLSLLCDRVQYYADAAQCEYDVTNAIYRMHNELQQAKLQPRDVATVVGITRVCFVIFFQQFTITVMWTV